MLASTLTSIHNLSYNINLAHTARLAILNNNFPEFARNTRNNWNSEE